MEVDGGVHDEPPLLSQLIYSQSSLYDNKNDSLPAVNTGKKVKQQQSVDEFYGLATTTTKTTTAAAGHVPAKRQMRRTRAKGRRGVEQYLESQSQADERQRIRMIHQQLAITKNRWKERKVDVRKEVDEGGVFERLVRKHWKKMRTDAVKVSEQPVEAYWEQGLRAPPPIPGIPTPSLMPIQKQNLPPEPKFSHAFPLDKSHKSTITEVKHMVQRQHLLNCPVSGVHFHQGAVAKVIARSLISGACATEEEQNIFLGTLYKVNPNLRSEAVLREASFYGWNFQLLRRQRWRDRNAAAEQLLKIDTRKRRSTQRGVMFKYEKARRDKVIAKLGASHVTSDVQEGDMADVASSDSTEGTEDSDEDSEDSEKDSDISENEVGEDDALIEAHKSEAFRFRSGAVPPKPDQPKDVHNLQFGAEDPYCHAMRLGRVKPATAELILATLVSRVAAADRDTTLEAHAAVSSFLEFLLRSNKLHNTIIINKYNKGVNLNAPAVAEYHAWMQYCRYVSNHRIVSEWETNEYPPDANAVRHANSVADEMSLVLEEIQTRPGIKPFPRIHLIYAICLIARELPPEASNIFARGDHEFFSKT